MINLCISRLPNCCTNITDECIVGDTISNNLILTEIVAASVARAVIDTEEQDKEIVSSTCNAVAYLKPTSLVEADEKEIGRYRGKLKKVALKITRGVNGSFNCRSFLEIERVAT